MNRYIHYGSDKFDINKFLPIVNQDYDWTKPKQGGIWASPIDAEFGWQQWCISEDFHVNKLNNYFVFDLLPTARICHIRSIYDLKKLPKLSPIVQSMYYNIDFELAKKRYDAIQLHLSEETRCGDYLESLYFKLYGWDCDSILIMNPDIIKQEDKNDRNKI